MAAEDLSESVARIVCQWTNRLPQDCRDLADEKLVAAAAAEMSLRDLAELFGEIYEQSRSESPDQDKDGVFDDRAVRLITTFQGAGVLTGDLTPECAEAVAAVLDASSTRPAEARRCRCWRTTCGIWPSVPQMTAGSLGSIMRKAVGSGPRCASRPTARSPS